jgi:succinate dehydrogenase flavin-adding protein (antitoxin of CptAB toxin-antitoxin module)
MLPEMVFEIYNDESVINFEKIVSEEDEDLYSG